MLDVAIIGAGPAGASTALHLLAARPSVRVAVFDRARLPREKPCGGAISRWGLEALERVAATPAHLGVAHVPAHAVRVRFGRDAHEHRADEPLGVVVERAVFDHALARAAEARGATVHEGHRLVDVQRTRDRSRLTFEARGAHVAVEARLVVGADGTGSATRKLAGFGEPGPRAQLLVLETETVDGEDVDRGAQGVLEFDLTPVAGDVRGYVWHFATAFGGGRKVSRGIFDWRGEQRGGSARRVRTGEGLRASLLSALDARGVAVGGARLKPYSERVYIDDGGPVATRDLLLVGEAAGLVDPVTGEGIAQAIVSGRLAAEEVSRALDGGGRIAPARYRSALERLTFHRHLVRSARLAPHVYGRFARGFGAALARSAAAVSAGADWYAGWALSPARKLSVGASFGLELARTAWTLDARERAR